MIGIGNYRQSSKNNGKNKSLFEKDVHHADSGLGEIVLSAFIIQPRKIEIVSICVAGIYVDSHK
jgi:hypothetical protein